jgi:anti-sigma regulatory factor (Ser/Thr protein kinase)
MKTGQVSRPGDTATRGGSVTAEEVPSSGGAATVERRFAGRIDEIPEVVAFIGGLADAWGLHPHRLQQLELAVEEVVVNICEYAYEVPPGEFTVRVAPGAVRFAVEVIDEGVPFDPLAVDEPNLRASAADRPIGGLGILLVRRVMDEVAYRRDGSRNVLTLVISR